MANKNYSYLIKVEENFKEGEYFILTSEQLPGLLLSGKDIKTLRADVPNVIKALYKLNYDMDVEVRIACDETPVQSKKPVICRQTSQNWSAIPRVAA